MNKASIDSVILFQMWSDKMKGVKNNPDLHEVYHQAGNLNVAEILWELL